MDLKKYDWSSVLVNIGKVATVFNPVVGSSLIVASQVVDTFNQSNILGNNEILKNDVIGLTRCSEILIDYIQKNESNQSLNLENVKLVLLSLQSLDALFDKNYAIMK